MGKGMTAKKKSRHKRPITVTRAFVEKTKREISLDTLSIMVACCMDEMGWTDKEVADYSARFGRYQNAVDQHLITVAKVREIIDENINVKLSITS